MRSFAFCLACLLAGPLGAASLNIDRIFGEPPLDGPAPREVKISPDGALVTYLRPREDQRDRYDLWAFDTTTGEESMLVDSRDLEAGEGARSAEAEAQLERKRLVGTRGIVGYAYSDDGSRLLIPAGGDAFQYSLEGGGLTRLIRTEAHELDFQLSPDNRHLSFVRDGNLVVRQLESGDETELTDDGGGTFSYGIAEFIAQEEMGRHTGHWWSPDSERIAYTRVDVSDVPVAQRVEYHAGELEVVAQRYPFAGTHNARVSLFVHEMESGERRGLDTGGNDDDYLYRVQWFPDNRHLAVQRQPRDQRALDLVRIDTRTGRGRRVLREESPIWIRLQDDLTFVEDTAEFVWPSRRSGFRHLYLYDQEGNLVRPLTAGDWEIAAGKAVTGVDAERRVVYFTAHADSPLTRHLYVQSLDATDPAAVNRISHGDGMHDVALADNMRRYVDVFQSPEQPPAIGLYTMNGVLEGWISSNALDDDHPYAPYRDAHVEPRFGSIDAADGQTMHYRLHLPDACTAETPCPVLVYVYGGPTGQQVTRHWPSAVEHWLQYMAQRGYAVFTLDNRGTDNRGVDFDAPLFRSLGRIEVVDQLTGVSWLKRQPWADADRIGVFGWSYGGYMTLMLLAQSPDTFAAGASGAPVTDWRLYDTHYTERFLGLPAEFPEAYKRSDVLTHAAAIADPLLVIHGMADDNVQFTHATRLFRFLQDNDIDFEMMTYPGAKHSLHRVTETGPHALKTVTRFLDRHLLQKGNRAKPPGPQRSN